MFSLAPGLTADEIARVQQATEGILDDVGLRVEHRGVRERCRAAGARVDDVDGTVRFPVLLQRELLARVPSAYRIRGVDGNEWTVGGESRHCLAIVTDPWVVDYETGRPRRPRLEDLRRHTIVAQQLPRVVAVSRMDFPVTDVEGPTSSLRALREHLRYHHKHIYVLAATAESFRQWLELGEILLDGGGLRNSGLFTVGVAVISPLTLSALNGELLLRACEYGFPIVPTVCPQAGTTAPYTLAGTLLQANAEVLGMACLTQIVNPGNPFLSAIGPSVADMRLGYDRYYTMDKVLWKIGGVQLARAYNMPVAAECGGTMTFRYDPQNGAEGMLFMLAAHASGCDMLSGIGSCYNAVGMSAEMMVIQTAWLLAAEHLARGMSFEDFDAAVASVRHGGPGGNYLTDDLTLSRLRSSEFFVDELFDLSGESGDGPSLLERAHARVEALVAGYRSEVPERVLGNLDRWFEAR